MPDTPLQTKLYIPPTRPNIVPRTRLLDKLNAGLHGKLTVVLAPAGIAHYEANRLDAAREAYGITTELHRTILLNCLLRIQQRKAMAQLLYHSTCSSRNES